jgi:S-adenosylmethionine:tRNA ribosyltransferase-isomerase
MNPINILDYTYELPPEKIADYPMRERDHSKLLVYDQGKIIHSRFDNITTFLPKDSILFFNNTKVIPARLLFYKDTGAAIEVFLLKPFSSSLVQEAMHAKTSVQWECSIGNLKRWTPGTKLKQMLGDITLHAELIDLRKKIVELSWSPSQLTFADLLSSTGVTPLPPYIKRQARPEDRDRYQTVYSHPEGAVAAPTAGLHFTDHTLKELSQKGFVIDFLTLHVGAGTFQPVKEPNAVDHPMHREQVIISRKNIEHLLLPDKKIVGVGTTSLRTLESLYWYGINLLENPDAEFNIQRLDPYQPKSIAPRTVAFQAVADLMDKKKLSSLHGETSIYIVPGYTFRVCDALITNFHQPGSTLILLVAAFTGTDWKKIYSEALRNDYRFLSYGDSSLLIPNI